jgi:hypothetical protein
MAVRLVWPISVEKRNGYARVDNKPGGNPALRIPPGRRIVINGVGAFYEFVSHNAGMELRHVRYFTAVAEELHFGRAAAPLTIAAPTLSHQIRALETLLATKLFTRRTKSAVALTHSGKRFVLAGGDMQYLRDRRGDFSG